MRHPESIPPSVPLLGGRRRTEPVEIPVRSAKDLTPDVGRRISHEHLLGDARGPAPIRAIPLSSDRPCRVLGGNGLDVEEDRVPFAPGERLARIERPDRIVRTALPLAHGPAVEADRTNNSLKNPLGRDRQGLTKRIGRIVD